MQKKIISIIIALILVISSFTSAFAVDISTPSAITLDRSNVSLMAVGGTAGTLANGDTVAPVSSTGTSYYYNGTSSTASNSYTINTWGMLVNAITRSISETGKSLGTILGTTGTNIGNAITDVWNRLGITNGYIDDVENQLNLIRTYIVSVANNTADSASDISSILNALTNNNINVDLGSPWQPYFMPADDYNFSSSDWRYAWNIRLNADGSASAGDYYNTNYLILMKRLMQNLSNGINIFGRYMITGVTTTGSDSVLTLYDKDLNTTSTGKTSYWYDFRSWGSNISENLARLSFVLASDEEINARQAAADNQSAVVDDFIKPTGSGSASASDFADVASIGGTMKDALSSNVGAENAFTSLDSSSEAWDWFSQSIADSLDTSSSSSRKSLKTNSYPTPMLDYYYSQLMETLKVK